MKRKLLFAALLLLAACLACGAALAATDPIVCSMDVSPSTLVEPGEVTVTITVTNSGDTDMEEPLTLYSPTSEVVTDFGDKGSVTLKAGETVTWSGTWDVNQHTLDNGQIVYFVKYALRMKTATAR
jgi:ABC-type glycerol-3-phosphate transport system substrate-binding protein